MAKTCIKSVLFCFLLAVWLSGPQAAKAEDTGAAGWMRVLGVKAETLTSLDKKTFMAGNLLATSIAPAGDGNFLVTGYIEPYAGHNANIFLFSLRPDGGLDWYREYAPPLPRVAGPLQVPRDFFTHVQVVPVSGGGAVLFFENIFLKVDGLGEPQYARQYVSREADGSGSGGSFAFKSAVVLEDGTFFAAGNYHPDSNPSSPTPSSVFVARLDFSGGKV